MGFAENLRKLRIERGMTQVAIASRLGVDKSTYNGYESGKRKPDVQRIKEIATILNVSADDLLGTNNAGRWREADEKMLQVLNKIVNSVSLPSEYTEKYTELMELAETSTEEELRTIISIWKLLRKQK